MWWKKGFTVSVFKRVQEKAMGKIKEKFPCSKIHVFRSMDSLSDQQDNLKEKKKDKYILKAFQARTNYKERRLSWRF